MSDTPLFTFEALGLDEDLLDAVRDLGYTSPTPIQQESIKALTKGLDLIGQSQTGTGKTAAFALPMIELIDPEDRRLQAVVLCPTRELSIQNAEEIRKLLKYKQGIRVLPVYGGQPINRQIADLRGGVQILTATPGRLIDHLRRHTLKLDQVQMVVLDEADEMLNMGFKDDIDLLLSQMPTPRQTVLLSATMPEEVKRLARDYMEDPLEVRTTPEDQLTVPETEQLYCVVRPKDKEEALLRLLTLEDPERCLIFCNTKKRAAELTESLTQKGLPVDALHGDLKQVQRDLTLRRFKTGDVHYLVATDVAARGLDIQGLDVVFNYDLPEDDEAYIHRIGRTGRAGKKGKAYSLIQDKEILRLQQIGKFAGEDATPFTLPSLQQMAEIQKQKVLTKAEELLSGSKAENLPNYRKYAKDIQSLQEKGYTAEDIAASLLTLLLYVPGKSSSDALTKAPKKLIRHPESTVKLFLSSGRRQNIKVKDLLNLLSQEAGLAAEHVGHIELLETFSFVNVPLEVSSAVIDALDGQKVKGTTIHVSLADEKK